MRKLSTLLTGACLGAATMVVAAPQTATAQNVGDAVRQGIQRGIQQGVNEGVRSGLGVPTPSYDRGYYGPRGNYDRGFNRGYYTQQPGWRGFAGDVLGFDLRSTQDGQWRLGDIARDTVAYRSGLRPGDEIVTIDGRTFRNMDEFNRYAYGYEGDRFPVTVMRNGQQEQVWIQVDRSQRDAWMARQQQARPQQRMSADRPVLGVTLDNYDGRVVAISVRENGPAAEAGLEQGDELLALNGNNFRSAREFSSAIERLQPGEEVTLTIARNGEQGQISPVLAAAGDVFGDGNLAQTDQGQRQTVMRPNTESAEYIDQLQQRINDLEQQVERLTNQVHQMGGAVDQAPSLEAGDAPAPQGINDANQFTPGASGAGGQGAIAPSNNIAPSESGLNTGTDLDPNLGTSGGAASGSTAPSGAGSAGATTGGTATPGLGSPGAGAGGTP